MEQTNPEQKEKTAEIFDGRSSQVINLSPDYSSSLNSALICKICSNFIVMSEANEYANAAIKNPYTNHNDDTSSVNAAQHICGQDLKCKLKAESYQTQKFLFS
jgi:hypothetical protein